jgi:hypothetical protein
MAFLGDICKRSIVSMMFEPTVAKHGGRAVRNSWTCTMVGRALVGDPRRNEGSWCNRSGRELMLTVTSCQIEA